MLNLNLISSSENAELLVEDIVDSLRNKNISDPETINVLSFLAAKSEISGRLFKSYNIDGTKSSSELCKSDLLFSVAVLIVDNIHRTELSTEVKLKWCNSALKLIDRSVLGMDHSPEVDQLSDRIEQIAEAVIAEIGTGFHDSKSIQIHEKISKFQILPVTVLYWEGPIARAYLSILRAYGYKPQKILNMVSSVNLTTKKPVANLLPGFLRRRYCRFSQKSQAHFWSDHIRRTNSAVFLSCKDAIVNGLQIPEDVYQESYMKKPLSEYSDSVVDLFVTGLNDPDLLNAIRAEKSDILFTGGGIVPKTLLDVDNIRFLHVHPGKLPQIRGADCTLWSSLIANQPSATIFYLAPGIDDGDVIWGDFLPPCPVNTDNWISDEKTRYRAIYAFYDPWVRAAILRKSLFMTNGFSSIVSHPQNHDAGMNFHFMHQKLQNLAFRKISKQ